MAELSAGWASVPSWVAATGTSTVPPPEVEAADRVAVAEAPGARSPTGHRRSDPAATQSPPGPVPVTPPRPDGGDHTTAASWAAASPVLTTVAVSSTPTPPGTCAGPDTDTPRSASCGSGATRKSSKLVVGPFQAPSPCAPAPAANVSLVRTRGTSSTRQVRTLEDRHSSRSPGEGEAEPSTVSCGLPRLFPTTCCSW